MNAMHLASIFFTMILVDNYVLVKFLGICPFLGVSKKLDSAVGMSLAVTFVMVLATAATWPIQTFLLTPESGAWDLGYLQTIVFILIIAILVQLLENILKKFIPALYKALGVYLPLITTNCTILGVTVLNSTTVTTSWRASCVLPAPAWASWWPWFCSPVCAARWKRL